MHFFEVSKDCSVNIREVKRIQIYERADGFWVYFMFGKEDYFRIKCNTRAEAEVKRDAFLAAANSTTIQEEPF